LRRVNGARTAISFPLFLSFSEAVWRAKMPVQTAFSRVSVEFSPVSLLKLFYFSLSNIIFLGKT
jgi:hypothetical protein